MPVETVYGSLASLPRTLRGLLASCLRTDYPGRVVGTISPELAEAARVLVACADDLGALAELELDAIPDAEKKSVWREVKRLRKAEAQREGAAA
jgi:hypothetical protein